MMIWKMQDGRNMNETNRITIDMVGKTYECGIDPELDPSQTAKADAGKPRLTLVPMQIVWDIAAIREYGNRKYPEGGKDNWKQVEPERYREAAFRHFLRYLDDPAGVDEESGLLHRWHLECNLAFLAELEKEGK